LFSFAIDISDDEGEEASSSKALGITSVEIKYKLEVLLALLHQDTAQLVDYSDPAKAIFKTLCGHRFQPMLRRFSFKLPTWKAANSSFRRLLSALPIEPHTPNSKRRCYK